MKCLSIPWNSGKARHFMKCRAVTDIWSKLSQYTHCLGIMYVHGMPKRPPAFSVTIKVYVRVPAFFFCVSIATAAYLLVLHLPAAAWKGD